MFNLFALTEDASQRILRLPLAADVQQQITETFQAQESIFEQAIQQTIDFDGKYKPEEDECLVIKNFDDLDDLSSAVNDPLSVPEISPQAANFESIKSLFCGYKNDKGVLKILLQNFERRRILSNTGFSLFYSAGVYRKLDGVGLTIDNKLAAILKGNELHFFSFYKARQMFDLSNYYIEATDSDIHEFSALPSVSIQSVDDLIKMSDTWVRRKFALILQSGVLTSVPMSVIKQIAVEFKIKIQTRIVDESELIVIPNDKGELKKLLRFLDEDYYKSSLLSRLHIANSKRLA